MNRWVRLAAAVVAMIQIANLQYGWTLFTKPLMQANGWTAAEVGWGITIFIALETWAMPVSGYLIDKYGLRPLMTIAGIMCAVGWAGIGMIPSLVPMYLLYALAGFGAAIVYCGSIGVALKWFPDRRGFAAGIIAAGFGSGAALFVSLLTSWIASSGYANTFLYSGILHGALIVGAAQFLGGSGLPVMASAKPATTMIRLQKEDFTPQEMLRNGQFYWLWAMMFMMGIGGLLATAQVSLVAGNFGISASALTVSLTLNPIANGSGRFFWGWVSDHIGRGRTMLIAFLIQSASLIGVMALGPSSPTLFIICMALVFFTWGEIYVLFPSKLADVFGGKYASANYGFLYPTKGLAAIVGGGLAALLFQSTGSWGPAFYGSAVLALISAGMAFKLISMPLPTKKAQPAPEAMSVAQR